MSNETDFIATVRRALGRREPLSAAPIPPALPDGIIRLFDGDTGLPERFTRQAAANAMAVTTLAPEDLAERLVELLRARGCRSAALPVSTLLDALDIPGRLRAAGIDARRWDDLTADAVYDIDAGITDVHAAIAETGSLAIRANPSHGRVLSLVPPIHIAIVQPRDLVADLLDLMRKLEHEGTGSGTVLITGPSKTTDIEGNLVTGVHGPGEVHVLMLGVE